MEKAKKPWWVKLIIAILSIIIIIALAFAGACIFVKVKYNVSVLGTIGEIKKLQENVDEEKMFPNQFTANDMTSAQTTVNAQIDGLIVGNEEEGFKISKPVGINIKESFKLTDKQLGAIAKIACGEGMDIKFDEQTTLKANLIQVKFSSIEGNSADVNFVVKVDVSQIKEKMKDFPLSWVKKYIPSTLYISSTVSVVKGEGGFNYTVESVGMTINNLTQEQTTSFLSTINLIAGTGTAQEINLQIGSQFVNALIGDANHTDGFVYSLRDLGVTDYAFEANGEIIYFVIKK